MTSNNEAVIQLSESFALGKYGDLLSAKDLSEILGISKQTTYKEIKKGTFGKPWVFGREYRIPKVYIVEKFLNGYQID